MSANSGPSQKFSPIQAAIQDDSDIQTFTSESREQHERCCMLSL